MIRFISLRGTSFALAAAAALTAMPALAIDCTASMSALNFGTVNPLSSQTPATATLDYTCTNSATQVRSARVCFSIGEPAGGATNPRLMHDTGGHALQFQLYQDPAHATVWGSDFFGVFSTPLEVTITVPRRQNGQNGTFTGSHPMYGLVVAGQTGAIPGAYTNNYLNGDTAITINEANGTTAPAACSMTQSGDYFPFLVSANVANQCNVSATALDFGTVGLLTGSTPGTSTLSVQCANGSAYRIGLDAGLNGGGNINARKLKLGAATIGYQLYSNSARTTVWGNTLGTNTVSGSGNGSIQAYTVFGSVPAQTTPAAGTYQDTITVSVTY